MLVRGFDFWGGLGAAEREGREELLRIDEPAVVAPSRAAPPGWVRLDTIDFEPAAAPVRLEGLGAEASPVLAAEEAVAAVAAAGSRTGRGGDFGRTFRVGEDEPAFFTGLLADDGFPGLCLDAGANDAFAPAVDWVCFGIGAFRTSFPTPFEAFAGLDCRGDAVFDIGWRLVTSGEPGVLGDLLAAEGDVADVLAVSEGFFPPVSIASGRDEPDCGFGGDDVFDPDCFLG